MKFYFLAGPTEGLGKIIQRFPQKDWDDTPFPQGIELVSFFLTYTVGRCICPHAVISIIQDDRGMGGNYMSRGSR